MNILGIVVACFVVLAGIYAGQKENGSLDRYFNSNQPQTEVLSEEDTSSEEVTPTEIKTPTFTLTVTPTNAFRPSATVTSTSQSNTTTNNTSVNAYVKNGQRYVRVNGLEVQLDEQGCYDYDQNGTKIHACVNN